MVRRLVVFAAVIVLLAGPGCFSGRSQGPGVITGYVYDDATGEGIPGADSVLIPSEITIRSGPDGSFRFEDIPRGTYTVRARAAGYKAGATTGVGVSPGKIKWAKLFLKRLPQTDVDQSGDSRPNSIGRISPRERGPSAADRASVRLSGRDDSC